MLWTLIITCYSSSTVHIHIIHSPSFLSFTFLHIPHLSDFPSSPSSTQSHVQTSEKSFPWLLLFSFLPVLLYPLSAPDLMKIPFAMFSAEHRSLHLVPLTWEQLCKHRLYTKTTCRWPWRPPEGTVRTAKWVSVSGERLRNKQAMLSTSILPEHRPPHR